MNAIESSGDFPILTQRLGELAAEKKVIEERLEEAPADLPDVMPDFEQSYRQRVSGLAEVLADPVLGQESTNALQALIEKVTFMPGAARGEVSLKLSGDLVGILAMASGKGAAELMTMSAAGSRNHLNKSLTGHNKPAPLFAQSRPICRGVPVNRKEKLLDSRMNPLQGIEYLQRYCGCSE